LTKKQTQENILIYHFHFPYLTAVRIQKLMFSPGSIQTVRARVKELTDNHVLHREYLYSQERNKEYVYWLSTSGRRKLRSLNVAFDFSGWKQPKQMGAFVSSPHFTHHMTTTDLLIAFLIAPVGVQHVVHYHRNHLVAPILPDGVVIMPHQTFLLEVDLATESDERIKEKITTYLPYLTSGQCAQQYKISEVPLIVWYTPDEKRRDKLLSLIEKALLDSYNTNKSTWFRVGAGSISPKLFFENSWITPAGLTDRNSMSLISV
jgi:hypothetical protein